MPTNGDPDSLRSLPLFVTTLHRQNDGSVPCFAAQPIALSYQRTTTWVPGSLRSLPQVLLR